MSGISLYYNNALEASSVSATDVAAGSSALYLSDDRLSFSFSTTGSETTLQIDQPDGNVRDFRYLALVDHDLTGGTAIVKTYATLERVSPEVVISGSITSADPMILDAGSVQSGKQFIDVELTSSGQPMTLGEVGLLSKFDSPRGPAIHVPTRWNARRTYVDLPNGERRSIQHASPARVKSYRITGLTQSQAESWLDLFQANEGIRLVLLADDDSNTYPCVMNKALSSSRELDNYTVELEFQELRR